MFSQLDDVCFGACNTLPEKGETILDIRVLDPERDRNALEELLDTRVDLLRELEHYDFRFGDPNETVLQIARGPDGGMVEAWDKVAEEYLPNRIPIRHLGLIRRSTTERIFAKEKPPFCRLEGPVQIELAPGEAQQFFVRLQPKLDARRTWFAVKIDHWLDKTRKQYVGGLTFLLRSRHDPFLRRDRRD